MAISIEVKGIDSVQKFINNTSKKILDNANTGIIQAGFFIEDEVKQSIAGRRAETKSVDTGRFLNSVKAEQKKPLTATISTNVPYAQFLEYGSSRLSPRHHFTNTTNRNKGKVKTIISNAIKV